MISIPLSSEAEARLRARAAAVGQDVVTYAARVLERLGQPPVPASDISGPVADEFRASGLTDEQLGDLLEDAKHDARKNRGTGR